MFPEGTVVAGSYKLERLLAKGGMGMVYLATQLRLRKKVAVKIMLPQFAEYKDQITRFLNEALGVADVRHRNIVDIIDAGVTNEGLPFFVMEYLEGETLRSRISRMGKLDWKDISSIMLQTLSGLSVLHSRKIIHRDMKPSNIFISREEDGTEIVKLMDFGVSKFHILDTPQMVDITTTGTILGTPSYMSPEQASGKKREVDERSDLYSCGVILYRSLTGINPFKGENYNETIIKILTTNPSPPSFFVKNLPEGLDKVVMKAIEKDKTKRYQNCREFIDELKRFVENIDTVELIPIPEGKGASVDSSAMTGRNFEELSNIFISKENEKYLKSKIIDSWRVRLIGMFLLIGIVITVVISIIVNRVSSGRSSMKAGNGANVSEKKKAVKDVAEGEISGIMSSATDASIDYIQEITDKGKTSSKVLSEKQSEISQKSRPDKKVFSKKPKKETSEKKNGKGVIFSNFPE